MTTDGLAAALLIKRVRNVTYKPGWSFAPMFDRQRGRVLVDVIAEMQSAYHPAKTVPLTRRLVVTFPHALATLGAFREWMALQLDDLERHETREWLRLDGEQLFEMHAEMESAA